MNQVLRQHHNGVDGDHVAAFLWTAKYVDGRETLSLLLSSRVVAARVCARNKNTGKPQVGPCEFAFIVNWPAEGLPHI